MRTHRTHTQKERETISYKNAQAQHPLSSHWIISNLLTVLRDKFARFSDIYTLFFEYLYVYLLLVVFALFLGSGNVSHILKSAALMNDQLRSFCFFFLFLLLLAVAFAIFFAISLSLPGFCCFHCSVYERAWPNKSVDCFSVELLHMHKNCVNE